MNTRDGISSVFGIVALFFATTTSSFAQSFSDNTGTQVWNSVPVMLDNGEALDQAFIDRVLSLNEVSAIAYQDCTEAIAEIEARYRNEPQRFNRQDRSPAPPQACVTLEETRQEMAIVRGQLEALEVEIAENNTFTW